MKYDLSVIIASRNEEFLSRTIDDVLKKRRGKTEVIAILDGAWADPPVADHPDVTLVYHSESIGQRAAVNEGARLSNAKYIMKLDAHCVLDEGFDVKLMERCEYDWTVIPAMYNLHAFDWQCKKCGNRWYQGPKPTHCQDPGEKRTLNKKCDNTTEFRRVMVWKPRLHRRSEFMRFDSDLHFQYWGAYKNRPGAKGDIADTMSFIGACWFMHRQRYLDLGGLDEKHGSWGQVGTEIACKSWLSGGRLVVNKKTWFAHLFRTQGGTFGFPYPQSGKQVARAREYSRHLFQGNNWPMAKHKFQWILDKFWPIPGWPARDADKKGIVYYTDNQLNLKIAHKCKKQILSIGLPITSVSLKPMPGMGNNIHLPLERGYITYFKQILTGIENSTSEIIFFTEHDCLYHPSHFDFTPPKKDVFYYNWNWWRVRATDGHAIHYETHTLPFICAYRELLLKHYREINRRIEAGENSTGAIMRMGFEPGTHNRKERVNDYKAESWRSEFPNVDIRHGTNLTRSKWKQSDFRNQRNCRGWQETDDIPYWGKITFPVK